MAFDAGMMTFSVREMHRAAAGGKIEKIFQPSRDEIVFQIKSHGAFRLHICAGSSPMIGLTDQKSENPEKAPNFCMLLRKHLAGARVVSVTQPGFERCARITLDAYDDLGFAAKKHIVAEIMGKYSNIILTDADDKIIALLKPVDFAASEIRPLLPGMRYEPPALQAKADPAAADCDHLAALAAVGDDVAADRAITSAFYGISSQNAAEIARRAAVDPKTPLCECRAALAAALGDLRRVFDDDAPCPTLLRRADGSVADFSFLDLSAPGEKEHFDTFAALFDAFFGERNRAERVHQRASDVERLISNTESRLAKKLDLLRAELSSADEGAAYKLYGDLVTANIYRMESGMTELVADNYYDEMKPVRIPLDPRLTPQANAQRYYKKYRKSESAKVHLAEQIALAERDLEYVRTVADALSRASGEAEIAQIRAELHAAGYGSRLRAADTRKTKNPAILRFRTTDGAELYVGKNNLANDYLRTHVAAKSDWWFHVKGRPGSHVVMTTDGAEPTDRDFTEAATVAAVYSSAAKNAPCEVDYVRVRELKKPAGAKPGFVIYHTNYSTVVTAEEKAVEALAAR